MSKLWIALALAAGFSTAALAEHMTVPAASLAQAGGGTGGTRGTAGSSTGADNSGTSASGGDASGRQSSSEQRKRAKKHRATGAGQPTTSESKPPSPPATPGGR